MSSTIGPAVAALVRGITDVLGPPSGETKYIVFWSLGDFEVAVQRDVGPHVWLSQQWRPVGQVFAGLTIERYPADKPRISNLKGNTPTLYKGHAARRLSFVGDQVGQVVDCVRACAEAAGVRNDRSSSQSDQ